MAGYASGLIQALRGNSSAPAASQNPGVSLFSPQYATAEAAPTAPKSTGMALNPTKLFNPGKASDFLQNKSTVIQALRANPSLSFDGGRDSQPQSNLSDAQWGAVKDLRDNYGWTNPFDAAGGKTMLGLGLAATGSPLLGLGMAYDSGKYQMDFINNYMAMDAMQKALMEDQAAAQAPPPAPALTSGPVSSDPYAGFNGGNYGYDGGSIGGSYAGGDYGYSGPDRGSWF